MARLECLGLYDELRRVGSSAGCDRDLIEQLKIFQESTGQLLGGM